MSPQRKLQLLTIGGGLVIIVVLVFIIMQVVKSLDFSSIIFSYGKKLNTDPKGHTNILLVGIGGKGHDGGDLTDTMIIASVDYENKLVPMLSLPRDLYVKSERLKSSSRINEIYYLAKKAYDSKNGMEEVKNIVKDITGVPIDYYVKVDFSGFKKIVDSLGGVDVVVPDDIYDATYPKGETDGYEPFSIKAGPQHLDGEIALKYARTRHTSGGDFGRAQRQQQILSAIKEKALSSNVLTNPEKIKALYDSVSESIETDLDVSEIIELAKVAKDLGKQSVVSHVLTNLDTDCGGYLYQPAREYFNDAFVFLPAGNDYDAIHDFSQNIFYNTKAIASAHGVQVLNGTKTPNLAGEVMGFLGRTCVNITYYGNNSDRTLTQSTIYYQPDAEGNPPAIMSLITKYLPYPTVPSIPVDYLNTERKQASTVVIVLGADYLKNRLENPFNNLSFTVPTKKPSTQQSTQSTSQTTSTTSTSDKTTSSTTTKPSSTQQ